MPVPREKLTIDGEYAGIALRNPAENPDTCRIAWFAWWAVQGMNPSPCSWSRLVGSDLGRVYGGASASLDNTCSHGVPLVQTTVCQGRRRLSTSTAPRSYPAKGEW